MRCCERQSNKSFWVIATISLTNPKCSEKLETSLILNSFPIIRTAEIYLFMVLKEKRNVLKRYLQQLYAFIIYLDDYSDKEKVKNLYTRI